MSTDNPYDSPTESGWQNSPTQGSVHVKRIGVASCAKMLGVLYGVAGLIVGAMFSLFALAGAGAGAGGGPEAVFGGVLAIILLPLFYGIGGLIGGAIMAFVYNLVASSVGGIEIELG